MRQSLQEEIASFTTLRRLQEKKQTAFQIQQPFFKAEIKGVSSVLKAIEQLA